MWKKVQALCKSEARVDADVFMVVFVCINVKRWCADTTGQMNKNRYMTHGWRMKRKQESG